MSSRFLFGLLLERKSLFMLLGGINLFEIGHYQALSNTVNEIASSKQYDEGPILILMTVFFFLWDLWPGS